MGDYCCGCKEETRNVSLKFMRAELLYDVKNYAYVEADVMGEPGDSKVQHAQHQLADIGEAGNIDRVSRILDVVHTAVVEMLYPFTKQEVVEEEIDDRLIEPTEYVVEMTVPISVSKTTVKLLSRLIHEYMVYRVMADWLSIMNPAAAQGWMARAEETQAEIERAKNMRRTAMVRKTHPW
jgi:hypothetical protein